MTRRARRLPLGAAQARSPRSAPTSASVPRSPSRSSSSSRSRCRRASPNDVAFGRYVRESGLAIPLVLLLFGSIWLFPLITALVAGDIIASEYANGTMKTVFTRSLDRGQIFAGKAATAFTYALAALARHGRHRGRRRHDQVGLPPARLPLGDEGPGAAALGLVAASFAVYLMPLAAIACFGLLLSALTRNSAASVVGTLMFALLMQLIAILPGLAGDAAVPSDDPVPGLAGVPACPGRLGAGRSGRPGCRRPTRFPRSSRPTCSSCAATSPANETMTMMAADRSRGPGALAYRAVAPRILILTASVGEGHDAPARRARRAAPRRAARRRGRSPRTACPRWDARSAAVSEGAARVVFFRFLWLWDVGFWVFAGFAIDAARRPSAPSRASARAACWG